MLKSCKAEEVFSNPMLISKIVSNLRYDYMKSYREVNKLWRFEVTKLTRPITRVCVNEENIESMLYASTVLGLSLHVRWSSIVTSGLLNLLQKYARYVQSLSWFVDGSSSASILNDYFSSKMTNGPMIAWDLQDVMFSKVTDLYLILTDCGGGPVHQYGLLRILLLKCPMLEKLRIEAFDLDLSFGFVLRQIQWARLEHLVSLHLGKGIQVQFSDMKVIKNMIPKIKEFISEAPISLDPVRFHSAFQGLWMESLSRLELNSPPLLSFPQMRQLKRLTITSASLTNTNLNLSIQFPALEDLNFSVKPGTDWTSWIPVDMPLHIKIRSLTWTCKKGYLSSEGKKCLQRLVGKLPNLKSLTAPADDEFLYVICKTLPHLKKLSIYGSQCSDAGVTGISLLNLCRIPMSVDLTVERTKVRIIGSYKTKPSLYDLKELEDLSLMQTGITDLSVFLAVSGMEKLRKLHISGITMNAILELISHPQLNELGVPQPIGNTLSIEDILTLRTKTRHIKIVTGWDADYIQSLYIS